MLRRAGAVGGWRAAGRHTRVAQCTSRRVWHVARRWERLYWVPFLVSMAWMAVLSYVLVWMVDLVGDTLGLPNAVSSITISAAATSVSDCFSSLIVARKGNTFAYMC